MATKESTFKKTGNASKMSDQKSKTFANVTGKMSKIIKPGSQDNISRKKDSPRNLNKTSKPAADASPKDAHTSIPRNVNYYRHLIDGGQPTNENDIEWVLKLRTMSTELKEKLSHIPNQEFLVTRKTLEGRKDGKVGVVDVKLGGNTGSLNHLLNHRLGPTAHSGVVAFESSLRGPAAKSKDEAARLKQLELNFTSVAFKDRHEAPQFLPPLKDELTIRHEAKAKGQSPKIKTVGGSEGYLDYPPYDFKLVEKNVNDVRHLHAGNFLSSLKWETKLRLHGKEKKVERPPRGLAKKDPKAVAAPAGGNQAAPRPA